MHFLLDESAKEYALRYVASFSPHKSLLIDELMSVVDEDRKKNPTHTRYHLTLEHSHDHPDISLYCHRPKSETELRIQAKMVEDLNAKVEKREREKLAELIEKYGVPAEE